MVRTVVWVVNDHNDNQRGMYPVAYFTTRAAAVAYLGRDDRYNTYIRKISVYETAEEKCAEENEEFRRIALMKLTMKEREALGLPQLP